MVEDFDIEAFIADQRRGINGCWSDFQWCRDRQAELKLDGQLEMLDRLESALKYHRERKAEEILSSSEED